METRTLQDLMDELDRLMTQIDQELVATLDPADTLDSFTLANKQRRAREIGYRIALKQIFNDK